MTSIIALHGVSASRGVAMGPVHVIDRGKVEIEERHLPRSRLDREVRRYQRALETAGRQLAAVKQRIPTDTTADIAAFIDTHLLMLEDAAISSVPIDTIRSQQCNAEWALKLQRDALVAAFDAMDDPYLRTRKDDVDHVADRVQAILQGRAAARAERAIRDQTPHIVFADDLTPADTVLMQHQGVLALLTEFGGPNSHTAILARSLRIPAVVGMHNVRPFLRNEDMVIVDGRQGVALVHPDEDTIKFYRRQERSIARERAARRKLRNAPAVSKDGEQVLLLANAELPSDLPLVRDVGASGIGLYRTEFLFMNRDLPPDEEEQVETYSTFTSALRGAPVTIRTLDLGADKTVDGSRPGAPTSANPALGLRAVRLCLKEQTLFRPQIRAILRVSAQAPVRMMIPMLSNTQELAQVLQIVEECRQEMRGEGLAFNPEMPIGAMIEVPAAAICADIFARHLDFLSIGTNDLIQYTIAIDRVDDEVNYLYDPLHPAVLRLIQMTIKAGQRANVSVAMCGEMAGDVRYTRLLLGMGLKEFSVHPNALLELKQVITHSQVAAARRQTQKIMRATSTQRREELMEELNTT